MFFQQLKRVHEDWIGVAPNGEVGKSIRHLFKSSSIIDFLSGNVMSYCCASVYSCSLFCPTHIRARTKGSRTHDNYTALFVGVFCVRSYCCCSKCNGYDPYGHHQNTTRNTGHPPSSSRSLSSSSLILLLPLLLFFSLSSPVLSSFSIISLSVFPSHVQ